MPDNATDDPFALFDGSSDDDDDDDDDDEDDDNNYQSITVGVKSQNPPTYSSLLAAINKPIPVQKPCILGTPRWYTSHPPLKMGPIQSIDTLNDVGGSRGYVASRAIPAGTLILRERMYLPWPTKTRTSTLFVETIRRVLNETKDERDEIMTTMGQFYPQRLEDLPEEVLAAARREYTSLLQPLAREHDDIVTLDALLQLVVAMQSNAFGSGFFLHCSIFNHSCDPNCVKYTLPNDASISEVRACRDIAEGDAVTISYLLPLEQLKPTRQNRLRHQFGFTCSCSRCEAEEEDALDSRYVAIERQLLDVASRDVATTEQMLDETTQLLSDALECGLPPQHVLFIGIHQLIANACADWLQRKNSTSTTHPSFSDHAILFLRSTVELWELQRLHLNPLHLDLTRTYADLSHGIQLLLTHDSQRLFDEFPQFSSFKLASHAEHCFRQCHEALRRRYES